MQEEVENRTVNLAVTTTRLTARALYRGINAFLAKRKRAKACKSNEVHGKQSVKDILKQPQSVSRMPVNRADLREFYKLAKKYGVDFAVTKDRSKQPPVYTVFFKAKDTEALQHIADTLLERHMHKKTKKPSILSQIRELKEIVKNRPRRVRHRKQEHSL